jgi:penicillin-binding protein 1A
MLEMVSGFSVFANGGERVTPIFIKKIVTMKGEVLEENFPFIEMEENEEDDEEDEERPEFHSSIVRERVLSPQIAYIMTHLLEGVVQHGTGQGAKVLGRPVAGKTGTSSDFADAWFIGYTPSLIAGVWVGFDDKTSLGPNETGARAALPIWTSFMSNALREMPIESFKPPQGIKLVKVYLETGLPVDGDSPNSILEAFLDETALPKGDGGKEHTSATPIKNLSPSNPNNPPMQGY